MQQKGASPIDFAMALSVMVVVIAFSIFYITNYFSRISPNDKTSELQSSAAGTEKILFGTAGIPQNWENNNYPPVRAGLRTDLERIAITAAEKGGVNHSFEEADLHIVFDPRCLNAAYNNSIRVYDSFMNETPFRIYNSSECAANSGFLREANIGFLFNITGNTSQVFWLYYTNNTATPKKTVYNFSYDPSLVGYWKLDSVNGTNYTLDSTNYDNDGSLGGGNATASPWLANGQINNGLQFDGANDYVDAGNGASLNTFSNGSITIEAWIKMNSSSGNQMILERSPAGTKGFNIFVSSGSFVGRMYPYTISSTKFVSDNIFHNVVMVNNNATNGWILYVDGIAVKTQDGVNYTQTLNTEKLYIGTRGYDKTLPFNGTIDEVRIYNRSLSAREIQALYNYTRPNYVVSSGAVPAVSDKKISALQNLSYSDAKNSLDLKGNFNITACEYSFGRHVPDTANTVASAYPIIVINSSGSVKPCLASVNVW